MLPNPVPFFEKITDFRRKTANKLYPLAEILTITLCAILSGADDFQTVVLFAKEKYDWLKKIMVLENGIPSHDTFERVFARLDPSQFEEAFKDWAAHANIGTALTQLCLDGKSLRRTRDSNGGKMLHMLHAWSWNHGLLLAQQKVDEKSNEIKAIPDVLELFDLKGVIVTVDAMGCQTEIAKQIVKQDGDYIFALKGNHGDLHEDVKLFMDTEIQKGKLAHHYTIEKNHGRIEERKVYISHNTQWLNNKERWTKLQSMITIESSRTIKGKTSREKRYYISSLQGDAEKIGQNIRNHWSIENNLHWVLDMVFNEDDSRVRKLNAAENMSIIRRIALNLLKLDTSIKNGLKAKRYLAIASDQYREKVLGINT